MPNAQEKSSSFGGVRENGGDRYAHTHCSIASEDSTGRSDGGQYDRAVQIVDHELILDAAAKFYFDVATHKHGYRRVLQHFIAHSTGRYRY
ncbi:hypothetical protein FNV43_RR02698 [Rhamnella rubrinervis]|uniref:Uncharacterized protein n=1 Tax=Rhamnella rubrinervis TaxID=2594499 RepID=A0A8K0HIB9_9ROSA|nr:hypothetical protein FNV43_RR02698 [Rhamnella rubrinervis]